MRKTITIEIKIEGNNQLKLGEVIVARKPEKFGKRMIRRCIR